MTNKLIYNVTVKIDPSIEADWMAWMTDVHIPKVMETGRFESYKLSQLLFQDDAQGKTYAIQYVCASMKVFHQYQSKEAPKLQEEHTKRYKDSFVAFRSVLQIESEGISK